MGKKNKKKSVDQSEDFGHNPFAAAFGGPKGPPPSVEEQIEHDLQSAKLRVEVTSKGRRGRTVCIVRGIPSGHRDKVAKKLKKGLGTGATWEDDDLVVMGDQRERVIQMLEDLGAKDVKPSGG
jgi:translation initiation factor 1